MRSWVDIFLGYVEQGGYVMPALILTAMGVWYALGYRIALLWRGAGAVPRQVVRRFEADPTLPPRNPVEMAAVLGLEAVRRFPNDAERSLEWTLAPLTESLSQFKRVAATLVAIAPLLGLLGTVSGMIETFAALGDMALFSQSGGIAGGISQALLTTQFGLAIAIPGLVLGRFLERRQGVLTDLIDEVSSIVQGKVSS